MIDITSIVLAVVGLAAAVITTFFVPWIRSKVAGEKLEQVLTIVDIAVAAAEQIGKQFGFDGNAKYQYVVGILEGAGYTVDVTVKNAIEAAVLNLHNELLIPHKSEEETKEETVEESK